jgi:hypothetical protein
MSLYKTSSSICSAEVCYDASMRKSPLGDSNASRLFVGVRALRELGIGPMSLYALYQLGLRSGYFYLATRGRRPVKTGAFHSFLTLPEKVDQLAILGQPGQASLLVEADEIVAGRVRLFGGAPVPLEFAVGNPPTADAKKHWTSYELSSAEDGSQGNEQQGAVDVKILWEPARFGWVHTLGRAYHLTGDERYPAAFWCYAESFLDSNPPYLGLHWISAQEVALRLLAFTFALHVFYGSAHLKQERATRLEEAIADHASRIPPTLVYARAQNNNHLLAEAAGLFTAGVVLPDHPSAKQWRSSGWKWFNCGLQSQIAADGSYVQHSANYHRLMLQLALWMACLGESQGRRFPSETVERLAAATAWLMALLDPQSGRVPNLGPNDGAYVLPLTVCPYADYRPVLQTAASLFLGERPFHEGLWDEMSLWLQGAASKERHPKFSEPMHSAVEYASRRTPHVLRHPGHDSWAYFRVARFVSRPGHADQLHLDLWWRGLNLAQDAGTYLYNAPPPWNNSLTSCQVHNTVSINGSDQMTPVGRFLYLDWAQAEVDAKESLYQEEIGSWRRLVAWHDGYRSLGVIHRRYVEVFPDGKWLIRDSLLPARSSHIGRRGKKERSRRSSEDRLTCRRSVCVHWLLPDWSFEVEDDSPENRSTIRVLSPYGWLGLVFSLDRRSELSGEPHHLQVVRAGELVYGSGTVSSVWGWSSPTYADKIPALSVRLTVDGELPFSISSEWVFPKSEEL